MYDKKSPLHFSILDGGEFYLAKQTLADTEWMDTIWRRFILTFSRNLKYTFYVWYGIWHFMKPLPLVRIAHMTEDLHGSVSLGINLILCYKFYCLLPHLTWCLLWIVSSYEKWGLLWLLWLSSVIWWHISRSTLVIAWCLIAPSHYLNQCWVIISQVLWHWLEDNFQESTQDINS